MKCHIRRLGAAGLFLLGMLAKAGPVPEGYPVDRYSTLWKRSPFTIASVQQDAVPDSFASKLALVGVARIGSEDFVILLNKDSQERINVSSITNGQGLKLIAVEANPDPLKASATIQKGTEIANVKYDQTLLAASSVPVPAVNVAAPQALPPNGEPPIPHTGPTPVRRHRPLPMPTPYQALSGTLSAR